MQRKTGVITLVQEGRFRLSDDEGRSQLFILASGAPLEPQDLEDLARRMARVEISFETAPGLMAALAHDIAEPTALEPVRMQDNTEARS